MPDVGKFLQDFVLSTLFSRRCLAMVAVAIVKANQEKFGLSDETMDVIVNFIIVYVGAETLRSSKDGSGIVTQVAALIAAASANAKKDAGGDDAKAV